MNVFFFATYVLPGAYQVGVPKHRNILRTEERSWHEADKWKGNNSYHILPPVKICTRNLWLWEKQV